MLRRILLAPAALLYVALLLTERHPREARALVLVFALVFALVLVHALPG